MDNQYNMIEVGYIISNMMFDHLRDVVQTWGDYQQELDGKKHPPLMYLYRMSLWSFMECSFGYHSIKPDLWGIDRTGWNKQVHEPSLLIL